MNERKARILTKVADEGFKTAEFFRQIPATQWDVEIYSDSMTWTIRAIMYHMLDTERSFNRLFRNILSGGSGVPEGFNLNEHNTQRVETMGSWDPATFSATFLDARHQNIAEFDSASDNDLDRIGRHPGLGMTTLEKMLKILFMHNRMHQQDIQKALAEPTH
jgi:hypothetical protein